MTADQLALLGDTRLPSAARVLGLLISLSPDGLEATKADLGALMGPSEAASDDTIGRHLKRLEVAGWVKRTAGGRGHGDTYRWIAPHGCGANDALRSAFGAALSDSYRLCAALSVDSAGSGAALNPPSSSSPPVPIPPRARETEGFSDGCRVIDDAGEKLAGCRDSLRDYLATGRVHNPPAYVYRVIAALEGSDEWMWSDRTGTKLEPGRRTKILAAAFNELALGDETGQHFPDPPGGFGNLRSKVRYLVAAELGVQRDTTKRRKEADEAAAEEADLQAKREAARDRARSHSMSEEERLTKEGAERAARIEGARSWLATQPPDVHARIDRAVAASLRRLGQTDPKRAPKYLIGPALADAVDAIRGTAPEARSA